MPTRAAHPNQPQADGPTGDAAALAAAECLGLIGAVDPALVDGGGAGGGGGGLTTLAPPGDRSGLPAQLLSSHLVRLLRVADSMPTLDAATFATQEVLRHYANCGAGGRSMDGDEGGNGEAADGDAAADAGEPALDDAPPGPLLAALRPGDRELVSPFLGSRYQLVLAGSAPPGTAAAAVGRGAPAWRWLAAWLRQMVERHVDGEGGGGRLARAAGGAGVERAGVRSGTGRACPASPSTLTRTLSSPPNPVM